MTFIGINQLVLTVTVTKCAFLTKIVVEWSYIEDVKTYPIVSR